MRTDRLTEHLARGGVVVNGGGAQGEKKGRDDVGNMRWRCCMWVLVRVCLCWWWEG